MVSAIDACPRELHREPSRLRVYRFCALRQSTEQCNDKLLMHHRSGCESAAIHGSRLLAADQCCVGSALHVLFCPDRMFCNVDRNDRQACSIHGVNAQHFVPAEAASRPGLIQASGLARREQG